MFSCSKSKEKKIIGSWEQQYFVKYDDDRLTVWTFADDQTVTEDFFYGSNIDTTIVGTYTINVNLGTCYLTVEGFGLDDGKYQILKLNKKFLIMQRVEFNGSINGAFSRKEFVKK